MGFLKAIGAAMALAAGASASAANGAQGGAPAPVEVMVVGTWHFAGSDSDLVSFSTPDILEPNRQAELERVAAALAEFRPTKIMVERVAPAPDLIDPVYAAFEPARLGTSRDERTQVGYRLAHRLGHARVYAIDEQPKDGEPDYFPFGKLVEYDRTHGRGDLMARLQARLGAMVSDFNDKKARMSIAELLADANAPARGPEWVEEYYEMLRIGDSDAQPGAELNAMYYMRNAKIFAKLMTVAEPGDRILVLYGNGHSYWLRHFAEATRGFVNVDPVPYLRRAAEPR